MYEGSACLSRFTNIMGLCFVYGAVRIRLWRKHRAHALPPDSFCCDPEGLCSFKVVGGPLLLAHNPIWKHVEVRGVLFQDTRTSLLQSWSKPPILFTDPEYPYPRMQLYPWPYGHDFGVCQEVSWEVPVGSYHVPFLGYLILVLGI